MALEANGFTESKADDAIVSEPRVSVRAAPSPSPTSSSFDRTISTSMGGPEGDDAEDAFLDLLARQVMFWC